jgi:nitrite reductase/ring-hydroxylating ferredoxin subunit
MTYVKVCNVNLVMNNTAKSFNIEGQEIMVINLNGAFYCLQARCTHAGAPLAEGTIDGDILTCPWHGSKFRIATGEVVRGPAERNLRVYNNIVRDGILFAELNT